MKKFLFFASAALVLASCSSEAEEAVIKPNETPEEVLELTEIKLGGGAPTVSAETRAAVELSTWNNTPVGIFGVNENGDATDNDWSVAPTRNAMAIADEKAVILLNEPATVAPTTNVVSFDTGKIYFPRGNSKNYGYTFLGYYPYVPTGVTPNQDNIEVTGKFDGTQDIMAGKALSAGTLTNGNAIGYNAKYIRDYKTENGGADPNINIEFKHLTTKINVQLLQGSSYQSTMCNVYAAWFEVAEDYRLTFAKDTPNDGVTTTLAFEGNIVNAYAIGGGDFDPTKSYKMNDIVRYDDGAVTKYYKFTGDHTGTWTGNDVTDHSAITPDVTTPSNNYTIFVTPDPQANSGTTTKTLYLVLNDDPTKSTTVAVTSPTGGFEAGKAYTVTVTINGPEEIKVTASIANWEDGGAIGGVEI